MTKLGYIIIIIMNPFESDPKTQNPKRKNRKKTNLFTLYKIYKFPIKEEKKNQILF